jgi:polar amino acid transport system substrate-binding protein
MSMVCSATISALATGLVLANAEPVVIATDAPFPAYTFIDDQGTITGYERDVMDQVCARAALPCSWVDTTFENLIPGVMSGEYDVVLGGMAVTDERRGLVDFTTSYHSTDDTEWYIGRPGAPPPDAAMTAVQSGTVHHNLLRKTGRRHISFATEAEVMAALAEGSVDLAFGPFESRPDMDAVIGEKGYEYLYSDLLPDDGIAMAVCKGNADLLDSLNAALKAMLADGTLEDLENRWFY